MSGAPTIGSTVLHYKIVRAIGSGGMGVVYEAEDGKLGRRVALKFLPPDLARDRPALERFQREARAASALNHPNICTVYAIEECNGDHFIAMELLDGDSLERRIASRPLAWDALIDIGIQTADALGAAHARGIVHRDIKPANIFLTHDGRAKVLDFGVAQVTAPRAEDAETVPMVAADHRLTGRGMAVGTIAYMSPEQARGDDLDARSDLFSLAAVLYEMSTGQPAFAGKTSAVIFQKILDGTPDPPSRVNPALPQRLEEIIVKGLEKDRDLRYQTAADLRGDLKRLKRDASSGKLSLAETAAGRSTTVTSRSSGAILVAEARRHKALSAAAAVVVLGIVGAAGYGVYSMLRQPNASASAAGPNSRMTISRLTTSGDVRGCGSISPDGKYVVYCDFSRHIRVRQVATGSTVQIAEGDGSTTFSPDGDFVYLATNSEKYPEGVVWAIPTLGGEPRRVVTGLNGPVGLSPDGKRVAFVRFDPQTRLSAIVLADVFGGNERRLAVSTIDTSFASAGVSWSPDGKLLSVSQSTIAGGYRMRPVVVDVETGKTDMLDATTFSDVGRTVWLPGSREILFSARKSVGENYQFWTARYPGGPAARITTETRGVGNMSVSVTADGSTIATVPSDVMSNLWSTNADASAPLVQWTSGVQLDGDSGIAPQSDGRVFYTSGDGVDIGIWSVDAAGTQPRKLTRQYGEGPSIPADASFVVFMGLQNNLYGIWRMQPDGTDARAVSRGQDDINPVVSPDGKWIYYNEAEGDERVVRIPAEGGDPVRIGELTNSAVTGISPDGRELLVGLRTSASQRATHAIANTETGAITARLTLPPSAFARWGRDRGLIAYVFTQNGVGNVWEQPISGGAARQLTKFTTGRLFSFEYSPDGKRLFLARGTRTGDVVLIRGFR